MGSKTGGRCTPTRSPGELQAGRGLREADSGGASSAEGQAGLEQHCTGNSVRAEEGGGSLSRCNPHQSCGPPGGPCQARAAAAE